ncbi:reverse transcriptase domain-containing protein [Tanacetum coccineum]
MDYILKIRLIKNSLDAILFVTISEKFTMNMLLILILPLWDGHDDELFDLETANDDTYDDPFDSKEEKIKDSKILIDELDLPVSNYNPPLYELPFHKEVLGLGALLSFSSEYEEKVFNPGILTSKRVHSSLLPELSHRGPKAFKVIKICESPMEIFPCSYQEDIRVLDVPWTRSWDSELVMNGWLRLEAGGAFKDLEASLKPINKKPFLLTRESSFWRSSFACALENSNFPNNSNVTIPRRQNRGRAPNIVEPELRTIVEFLHNAERYNRKGATPCNPRKGMETLCFLPEINADHFEIKTNLLQLVQANPFHGYERENPHAHINSFKRITSTLRFRDVPNDVIKLMMFPYSLEGNARLWYEKEPPNSILTWEDLVTKFVNQFFPPSKTTHLKNEISCFTQKFEETFSEAWERFKEMLRACPHHGFTELTQVDTFYNGLNENDQDSLNAAAGGNLLSKTTREALNIIENKSKVRYSRNKSNVSRMNTTSRESVSKTDERIDKLADQLSTLVEIVSKKVSQKQSAPFKRLRKFVLLVVGLMLGNPPNRVSNQMAPPGFAPVQNNGQNRYNNNQGQGNNFNRGNNFHGNQGFQAQNNHAPNFQNQGFQNQPFQVPNNHVQQEFSNEFSSYKRNNDQMMRNMQNQINSLKGEVKNEIQNTMKTQQAVLMNQQNVFQTNLQNMLSGFFQNQASTSGTLPSNTIPNPKGEMKAITTRSGVAYEGPSIPTNPSPKKVVERETEETTDKEQNNFQGSTAHIPPLVNPIPSSEPDILKTLPKPNIPYPSRRNDQKPGLKGACAEAKDLEASLDSYIKAFSLTQEGSIFSIFFFHTPSKANLDYLFDPLYDEYYAGRNEEVSTNSATTTLLNNPNTPSTSSIIVENNKAPQIVSTSEETTSPITREIPDEFIQEDFANLDGNTFINPFGTHATDEAKSSSTNTDPSNMHEFHQLRRSADKWTQAHILEQVIGD